MTGIFTGNTGAIRQGWKVKWSPTTGGQSEIRSLGFNYPQMLALAGQQAALGIECELSFQHNTAELVLRTSNPTYQGFGNVFNSVTDKWEVAVDDEKPSLFENSSYLSLFNAVNAAYGVNVDQQFAQCIKQASDNGNGTWGGVFANLKATTLKNIAGTDYLTNPGDSTSTIKLSSLYALSLQPPLFANTLTGMQGLFFFATEYLRGRTNYAHSKYTLKHTTLAPDTYGANVADFHVEKIYSISQLLSECRNPNLWILPLPGYLTYKILNYPVPVNMPASY